jgi:hypothetical protein
MVGKMIGIVVTILYVLDGSIKTMNSTWAGPSGQLVRAMGSCFHPETKVKLKSGEIFFMKDLPFSDVSYCMYGKEFRKQTRLWNNFGFKGKICNHKEKHKNSCGNGRKEWTLENLNSYEKGSIPKELVLDIIKQLEKLGEK